MGAAGTILIGAAAVGAALLISDALATKKAGDALQSDIDNVIFKGITGGKAYFDIVFKHTNPTNRNLNFDFVFLDIYAGSYPLAKIREEKLGRVIDKRSVTSMVLTASVSLIILIANGAQMLLTGNIPDKVLVTGNIRVNEYTVPFNSEYPLTVAK